MSLENTISKLSKEFLDFTAANPTQEIKVISHFDTDGITSASIAIKTFKKLDIRFSIKILKSIDTNFIEKLPKDQPLLFLDLASGNLEQLSDLGNPNIFIIDHHELPGNSEQVPETIKMINPHLDKNQQISSSGLTYLFCKEILPQKKSEDMAKLAILGMIGDCLDKELESLNHNILQEGEVKKKRGLLIYPSTRPLNRALEYSSNPFIPGVTGDTKGTLELLREINLTPQHGSYPTLLELDETQMSDLITAVTLRMPSSDTDKVIGDIYLLKLFNKLEDAREISAKVNACSRMGSPHLGLQLCLELTKSKQATDKIYTKYKQCLVSSLKIASERQVIKKGYVIINAKDDIPDTVAGTVTSILSNSSLYEPGTVITTLALDKKRDLIKVSTRKAGRVGRNLRELLEQVVSITKGEIGGHCNAAGCLIPINKEAEFLKHLEKHLEVETVKV